MLEMTKKHNLFFKFQSVFFGIYLQESGHHTFRMISKQQKPSEPFEKWIVMLLFMIFLINILSVRKNDSEKHYFQNCHHSLLSRKLLLISRDRLVNKENIQL